MITHKIIFQARPLGAIGKLKTYRETIQLPKPDKDKAIQLLSDKYEHITLPQVIMNDAQLKAYYKKRDIERQINAISTLMKICKVTHVLQPRTVSNRLRAIERRIYKAVEDYSNVPNFDFAPHKERAIKEVQKLFNNNLQGLFIDTDARGYSLKIDDELLRPGKIYHDIGLHTDFGQDGILAPNY